MTFRPSDDVLEKMAEGQQSNSSLDQYNNYNNVSEQGDGYNNFQETNNFDNQGNSQEESQTLQGNEIGSNVIIDAPVEEIKAPDLSDLLINNTLEIPEEDDDNDEKTKKDTKGENPSGEVEDLESLIIGTNENDALDELGKIETQISSQMKKTYKNQYISNGINDEERKQIVSGVEGAIHSDLDLLVDRWWAFVIENYKKIHHILFRWGIFILVGIIGIIIGILIWNKWGSVENLKMVDDKSVIKWEEDKQSDYILSKLVDKGLDLNVIVPYGSASFDEKSFQSKSNLILYKGIILPQLVYIDYDSENLFSLENFNNHEITRDDLENFLKELIMNDNLSKRTSDLPNTINSRFDANVFNGTLINGFNLSCLERFRASDLICNKFLGTFYDYGKYYNLKRYGSEILPLMRNLKKDGRDIEPICEMIKEYAKHSGVNNSDHLDSAMLLCNEDERKYYNKLINFIKVENSLGQPNLSDEVFDDPDLNAYKLLSSWQSLYNKLTYSEDYIESYLNYVQALINKDKGSNKFIQPIYKDLLYVFNADYLYPLLTQKSSISLKQKIDEINNGNSLIGSPSLLSQLTTENIIKSKEDYEIEEEELNIEDIVANYYSDDRLKIRKVTYDNDKVKVTILTELSTNKIFSVTGGETLKLIITLIRKGNALYVSDIKVVGQPVFSNILKIHASNGNVTFNAMIPYIDEQIPMRYKIPETEEKVTICDELSDMEDLALYNCDESEISFYRGDVEYNISLNNGILESFSISDEEIEAIAKEKIESIMTSSDNTEMLIKYIIDLEIDDEESDDTEEKIDVVNHFRIHFKFEPEKVEVIEGESDEFLVDFKLGTIDLQAHYNVVTHLLTKISYVACDKTLEIRNLKIELSTENEPKLAEIVNNPKAFLSQANSAAYKKYQKMCE